MIKESAPTKERIGKELSDRQIEIIAQALQYAACTATLTNHDSSDASFDLVELAELFGSLDLNATDFLLHWTPINPKEST